MPELDGDTPTAADLVGAVRKALAAAGTSPYSEAKTALLRDLVQELPALADEAREVRDVVMRRQYEDESISLAMLGDRWNMSKGRAGQIKNEAIERNQA